MNVKKKLFDLMLLSVRSTSVHEARNAAVATARIASRYKIDLGRLLRFETVATMRYRSMLGAMNPERES